MWYKRHPIWQPLRFWILGGAILLGWMIAMSYLSSAMWRAIEPVIGHF